MRRFMSALVGTGLLAFLAATAQAQAPPDEGPAVVQAPKAPAAAASVQWVERTHTQYRCEARQRVVPTIVSREVEEKYTYTEKVPVTAPHKRTETYYVSVPEEVVRQVPVCKVVKELVTDPSTGECKTICRTVTAMQEVRCVVTRQVARTREVVENVTTEQEVERVGTRRKTVQEKVNVTETYLVAVPYTTTVRVPVWPMQSATCCPAPEKVPAPAAAPAARPAL
jgi:hypothetical protein